MPEEPQLEAETPNELRAELKTWEVAFTKANGRKPAREDIKKNAAIGALSWLCVIQKVSLTEPCSCKV